MVSAAHMETCMCVGHGRAMGQGQCGVGGGDDGWVVQGSVEQSGADRHDSERAGADEQLGLSVSGGYSQAGGGRAVGSLAAVGFRIFRVNCDFTC